MPGVTEQRVALWLSQSNVGSLNLGICLSQNFRIAIYEVHTVQMNEWEFLPAKNANEWHRMQFPGHAVVGLPARPLSTLSVAGVSRSRAGLSASVVWDDLDTR